MRTYATLNHNSKQPIFMSCEHAATKIPKKYRTFGIKRKDLKKNPDWYDIGAEKLARVISKNLNARCLLPLYSRMVINLNKPSSHPKVINDEVFNIKIPGNQNIKDKKQRISKYYSPYHNKIKKEISFLIKKHNKIFYICIHSFFHKPPELLPRTLDIGILYKYKKDAKFCQKVKKQIKNLNIAYNQPYSAFKTAGFTINKYGKSKNITCIEFEVNDKHLRTSTSIKNIGNILSNALREAISNP